VSLLKKRIAHQAQGKTAAPLTQVAVPPGTPEFSPASIIYLQAPGTVGLGPLAPMVTADGALVPATMPGGWDQLRQAGRSKG
jgi:hypothetical protein